MEREELWDDLEVGMVVEEIWTSGGHDFRGRHGEGRLQNGISKVEMVECVAGMGLRGDRYFGMKEDYKGQVTFLESGVVEEMRRRFIEVDSRMLRRNFVVRGVALRGLIGRKFVVQGVEFEGSEECRPCYWMDEAVGAGAEEFLKEKCRGGIRARVVSGGWIRCGG